MRISFLLVLLLVSAPVRAQLSGTYTVGGARPDYTTIGAAFADLEALGVSGAVELQVRYGTYTGQLALGPVAGVSASARITVRGIADAGTGTLPVLRADPPALAGWVAEIGADYVTLEDLAIRVTTPTQPNGNVLLLTGDHAEVRDCEIESVDHGQATGGARAIRVTGSDALIVGNTITGGTRGIDVGASASGENTRIRLNAVTSDSLGIGVANQADAGGGDLVVRANVVTASLTASSLSTGYRGILVQDVAGGAEVARNQVAARRGIAIELVDVIGSAAEPTELVNNMAAMVEGNSAAVRLEGSTYVSVFHNTAFQGGVSAAAIEVHSGAFVRLQNNLLRAVPSSSYTLDVQDPSAVQVSDTNGHAAGGDAQSFHARWGGVVTTTLADFRTVSGKGASSIQAPQFLTAAPAGLDLHLAGSSVGDRDLRIPPLAAVSIDLDGDPRDPTYTYLGADEAAESLADPPPLSGTYSVNWDGTGDYDSFDDVLNDLTYGGVIGPVQFSVMAGTYGGRVTIPPITGASATNTISFVGVPSSGLTPLPQIYSIVDEEPNWVLRIDGDHIAFVDHIVTNGGTTASLGRAVLITGDDVTLDGCEIRGFDAQDTATSELSAAAAVYMDDAARTTLTDLVVPRASVGIYGDFALTTDGPTISGATISEPYNRAISLHGGTGTLIEDLVVDQTASSAAGGLAVAVLLEDPQGLYRLRRNEITFHDGDGIRIERGSSNGGGQAGLIANTLVATVEFIGGDTAPLTIRETDNLRVFHTTLYKTNAGTALVIDDQGGVSSGLRILNTIADGVAHAVDIGDAAAIDEMDHNVFWGGTYPYRVGASQYATLDAYRAATGFDTNSSEFDPDYVVTPFVKGSGDLRLDPAMGGSFALAGTPLTAVPNDVDGTPRSTAYPYIGGHELPTAFSPLSGVYSIDPSGGGDYVGVGSFVIDLMNRGMGGAVTAELVGGAFYAEAVVLGEIEGLTAATPLTFTGPASGARPVLSFSGVRIDLDGAHHVTFRRLRLERVDAGSLVAITASSDITFEDCEFVDTFGSGSVIAAVGGASGEGPNSRLTFRDNLISGGSKGIEVAWSGFGSALTGMVIEGNTFTGQSGAAIDLNRTHAVVTDNDITAPTGATSAWKGIRVYYLMESAPSDVQADLLVERNVIRGGEGTGIYWLWSSSQPPALGDLQIANNTVRMTGTGATRGIDLVVPDGLLVAHNTVALTSPDTTAAAVQVAFTGSQSQGVEVRNNLLLAIAGRALHRTDTSVPAFMETSWNVMHTSGPTLVEWGASHCPDVTCYLTLEPDDALFDSEGTATFADPPAADLHLTGRSIGDAALAVAALAEVPLDLDGQTRNTPGTYAGADAVPGVPVSPPRTQLPLAGLFTIDPAGGDFADFHEAVGRMDLVGIGGPVVFEAAAGTYPGRIRMDELYEGLSAESPVTFRSAPGEMAVIEWNAYNEFVDAVWSIEGVSHITLERLTIRALGTTYSRGLHLLLRQVGTTTYWSDSVTVRDVRFEAPNVSSFTEGFAGLDADGTRGLRVKGSTFINRTLYVGIDFPQYAEDSVIEDNMFELNGISYTGVVINATQARGVEIRGNQIQVVSGGICGGGGAIRVSSPEGVFVIEDNEIVTNSGGIDIGTAQVTLPEPVLIRNNTILQTADACRRAVELGATPTDFLHNTVVSTSDTYAAVEAQDAAITDLRHNVLVSTANRAVQVDAGATLTESGPNALWADGPVFATWHGTDVADLPALQAASGAFPGSVETRPTFVDEAGGDLRLPAFDGDLVVTPLASVPADIDGTPRTDPTLMGAFHLDVPNLRVNVRALLQGAYPSSPAMDNVPDPMRTDLVQTRAVPLAQPYSDASFDGTPAECDVPVVLEPGFFSAHPDIVDWVVIGLRDAPAGPDVACLPALLREDGVVLNERGEVGVTFLARAPGDYHVAVYHRNHLAAMTAALLALSETPRQADLALLEHYGTDGVLVEPRLRALRAGDGDQNGAVLAPDRQNVWLPSVGLAGYLRGDFNLDGSVLADDEQAYWTPNVGAQSGVPGAASLVPPTETTRQSARTDSR